MYEAVEVDPLKLTHAMGFLGFWAARRDSFAREIFPFSLDRSYLLSMDDALPRFIFSGAGVRSDNNRDLTGSTIEAFDARMDTTRVLFDHMKECEHRAEPKAWRVSANPCGRSYSYYKLYLPYPNLLLTTSWMIHDPLAVLTPRQREIAVLASRGLMNKDICRELDMSLTTLPVHMKAIRRKLGVRSRGDLVRFVLNHTM
jgi:DNA-binding CsgD family transcriptional regulator